MHVFLVGDGKTGINFFPRVEELLKARVADIEVDSVFVPFPEDIPGAVARVLREADLVFVFCLYEELDFKVKAMLSKLIELEVSHGSMIVKAVEENELPSGSDRLDAEKEKLAEKWSQFILDRLFNPKAFEPKEE